MKFVLRGFKLVPGLKINFWKRCLIRVNVGNHFLELAASFLHFRIGTLPFKYLGLPVGASFKRLATWQSMIDNLRLMFSGWGNRYISFLGGIIFLVNSIVNSISISYHSFMKISFKVRKVVVRI